MANIPIEDTFGDVVGKAQRGLKIDDAELARRSGVAQTEIASFKSGGFNEAVARKIAPHLNLAADALVALGQGRYTPRAQTMPGLMQFNTTYDDMTVNAYLVWDPANREAAAFDTGGEAGPLLDFAKKEKLKIRLILLTHIHPDHIADLDRLKKETGAAAHVSAAEPVKAAEMFQPGKKFELGELRIETRQTSGHARGGITFVISGLSRPVAVVGDALFAGSMGGGLVSFAEALDTNRRNIFSLPDETIVCPGHGPLTTVGEERRNNPFYAGGW